MDHHQNWPNKYQEISKWINGFPNISIYVALISVKLVLLMITVICLAGCKLFSLLATLLEQGVLNNYHIDFKI